MDLPRELEAAELSPAAPTPAIEIKAVDKPLSDVVREYIGRTHLKDVELADQGAVWKQKVTIEGNFSPREFFAMARRTYGVVAKAPANKGALWLVTDLSNERLQVDQLYELHGMLDTEARNLARQRDGLERFRKSIVDAVTVPAAGGVTEPAPTVRYSHAGDILSLRAIPEQQARLAAYLAKADRPPHRFLLLVRDGMGRNVIFVSAAPEAVPQTKEESSGAKSFALAVTPYLTSDSKPTVRLKGMVTMNGQAAPFDVPVKPDGTAVLLEQPRFVAQVGVVD